MTVNVPALGVPRGMDVDEFMGWLEIRPKEERWHLVEGTAIMMNPPTIHHQQISLNLRDFLLQAIRDRGLDLLVLHEVGVRVPGVNDFQPRPDVAVAPRIPDDSPGTRSIRRICTVWCSIRNECGAKFMPAAGIGSRSSSSAPTTFWSFRNSACGARFRTSIATRRSFRSRRTAADSSLSAGSALSGTGCGRRR